VVVVVEVLPEPEAGQRPDGQEPPAYWYEIVPVLPVSLAP